MSRSDGTPRRRVICLLVGVAAGLFGAAPGAAFSERELAAATRVATAHVARTTRSLASAPMGGRDNATLESARAQRYLIARLRRHAAGLNAATGGDARYARPFVADGRTGTNLLAEIRGRAQPGSYVLIGAHYDHLDSRSDAAGDCAALGPTGGSICPGATDNAAGVAAVLGIARGLRALPHPPRRSVVLALWDAEEDGLLGSATYAAQPLVPLADTVAYVNFDVLGATLLPGLRDVTFAVGAETGGAPLRAALAAGAAATSGLTLLPFSHAFGQRRSDHVSFSARGVPVVFFTDSTGGCYHTTDDTADIVAYDKLARQTALAFRTVVALAESATAPSFAAPAAAEYEDARSLRSVVRAIDPAHVPSAAHAALRTSGAQLDALVDNGSAAFDAADGALVLGIGAELTTLLTGAPCRRF